jgi:hypothetical protein
MTLNAQVNTVLNRGTKETAGGNKKKNGWSKWKNGMRKDQKIKKQPEPQKNP